MYSTFLFIVRCGGGKGPIKCFYTEDTYPNGSSEMHSKICLISLTVPLEALLDFCTESEMEIKK